MKLRSYQKQAVDAIFDAWQKFKSVLVVLPTGCGKTVVFASVIRRLMTAEVKAKGVGEQWKVHFSQAARTPLPLCVFALIVSDFSGRGFEPLPCRF